MTGPKPRLRRRPTQKEVAERAGVSQAVVSQALNDRQGAIRIGAQTRERVLAAMRELGYVPNLAARSLARGRNRILGVFTYEPVFPTSTRNFYFPFLEGIEEEAADLDHDLLLHTRPAHEDGRRVYEGGMSRLRLADGTLLMGILDEDRRAELARLLDEGHPVVFIGRREMPGRVLPHVAADYVRASHDAAEALHRAGHRRILYVGETDHHESAADRETGFAAAAGTDGRAVRVSEVTRELVARSVSDGVTGFLFENDRLAHAWTGLASDQGLVAPADYSFVVLGDPLGERELPPGWSHFRIPRREMGRQAVRLLVDRLAGGTDASITLPCTWVPGSTIASPRRVPG